MEVSSVSTWLRVDTPAKLNLFLEVLGKRPDGFHEIETLMTAISIYDTIFVTENPEGRIRLRCEWASGLAARHGGGGDTTLGELPPESENIVYQAAERLRSKGGVVAGATIHLVKRIPSAAGLGGASSDAAAALVLLNQLWRLGWPIPKLAAIAAEIGSDVPFFLGSATSTSGLAICRGRGEQIEFEPESVRLHFVVVKPPAGLSTAAVYRQCQPSSNAVSVNALSDALYRREIAAIGSLLFNRLQETAQQLSPSIERLRHWFQRSDVLGHQLSGSGTSYFGICRSAQHGRQLVARLRGAGLGEAMYATTSRTL
jgi:4-diphosphocytidyl-2-C-methyl-D-erythritol kinase